MLQNGTQTCHGEPFSEAVQSIIKSPNVVAAGLNCSDPQNVTSLLKSIQGLQLSKPIIVKPNSGELWEAHKG